MRFKKYIFLVFCAVCLTSCTKNPLEVDFKPAHEPMYNFTQSSQLLACTGKKIDRIEADPVDVYVSSIPDHTTPSIEGGFLTKDAVMMVTTAVSRLNTDRVAVVGDGGADDTRRQVQVFGAFTELNRTTQSNAVSGDMAIGDWEFELGKDKNINHIAIDLAMSENSRIIPHTPTSVSIFIHGERGDAQLAFDNGGDFATAVAYGYTGQEGFHSASRLLIETSVAVMMSSFYDLDITDCLNTTKKAEDDVRVQDTSYDKPVFDEEYFKKRYVKPKSVTNPISRDKQSNGDEGYKTLRPGIIDAPTKEGRLKAFETNSGETLYNVPQAKVTRDSYGRRIVKPSAIQQIPVEPKEYKHASRSAFEDTYDSRVATQKRHSSFLDIQSKSDVLSLLARSGITAPNIQIDPTNNERVKRYQWQNSDIKGIFVKFPLPFNAKFYEYADYYANNSRDSCGSRPPRTSKSLNYGIFEGMNYTSFDVVCENNTKKIYVFYTYNNHMNIINLKRLKQRVNLNDVKNNLLKTILSKK
jgi:hypothetical protein